MTIIERNLLVINHIALAEKIAKSKKRKLSHVSYEELKSAAYLGLVEAATNYNSEENDCFSAYAVWRIIGAVRDYLRELSWGSRSNPVKMEIISYELDVHVDEVSQHDTFDNIIKLLPSVNKMVLKLYYQENKKIKDIAKDMHVHQSRISQILSNSRCLLKKQQFAV